MRCPLFFLRLHEVVLKLEYIFFLKLDWNPLEVRNVLVNLHDQLLTLRYFDVSHILIKHIADFSRILNRHVIGHINKGWSLHVHWQNGTMILLDQMMVD